MAYNKTNWQSLPSTNTPISAGNLNKIENGIYDNSVAIDTLNQSVSNLTGAILWQNLDTSQDFIGQNIILSSGDYDMLKWFFIQASDKKILFTSTSIKGIGCNIDWIINLNEGESQENGVRQRNINYINDTTYSISNCLERPGSTQSVPNIKNDRLIPLCVVGYKTGLFNGMI